MKKRIIYLLFIGLLVSCAQAEISLETLLKEMTDRESIARFPDPGFTLKQFSSYDRAMTKPGDSTWFANWDRSMFIRTEENQGRKEYVMLDTDGPGSIVRFWMTFAGENAGLGILRIYFDGNAQAEIEGTAFDILSGQVLAGFPLAASVSEETRYENRGHNLYLPLPYSRHCKITYQSDNIKDAGAKTGGEAVYYNINYRTYPARTKVRTFTTENLRKNDALVNETNRLLATFGRELKQPVIQNSSASVILEPGQSFTLPHDGSLAIRKFSIKTDPGIAPQMLRSLVVEMTFDGQRTVWCPLGDFFGTGYQLRPSDTWYTSVRDDGTMECYWVMPFKNEARITVHNLGQETAPAIRIETMTTPWKWDKRTMYFGSTWHQYSHLQTGKMKNNEGGGGPFDMNYVTLNGKGVYAGDAIALFNTVYAWWGEGDEKIYVDGEEFPSHIGTGTEDYYGYAWCRPEKFTNHPFIAQPDGSGNFWPGYTVNIRQRGLDGIPFKTSLKFDMEMWHWTSAVINFAPVTWYYILPGGSTIQDEDRAGIHQEVAIRRSDIIPPVITNGVIEGENMNITRLTGGNVSYQNSNRWGWSQDVQLFWTGGHPGDTLTAIFESTETFEAHVTSVFTAAPDYGSIRLQLNGTLVPGIFNLYHPEVTTREIYLGRMRILEGENTLKVMITGNSPEAGKAFFGLDQLYFTQ
jgi:hypothetical protein